jgi:peptide/nickel transport system substrate-binding protein
VTSHRLALRLGLLTLLAASVACVDSVPEGGGVLVIGARQDPTSLFPPLAKQLEDRQVGDQLFERLAVLTPGQSPAGDAGFAPHLARRWTWATDSLSVTFDLDPAARWHDGARVRAEDLVFSFGLYKDSVVASPSKADLANVDSVTTRDSSSITAWFRARTPLQFHDLVNNLVAVPAHVWSGVARDQLAAHPAARAPIGNGRFRFGSWEPLQQVTIVADSSHPRGRPRVDRIVFRHGANDAVNLGRILVGEIDAWEPRAQQDLERVAADSTLRTEFIPGYTYSVLRFNLRTRDGTAAHPILGSREIRRALTMAIDRQAVITNAFGSLAVPALGPFVRAQFFADTTVAQLPFSRDDARRILDSLGWRPGPDGTRVRGGRPLELTVSAAGQTTSERVAVLVQEQWKDIGVRLNVEPLDVAALTARMPKREFEVIVMRITTSPSFSSLPNTWGSRGAAKGGPNAGSYQSAVFDAHLDSASRTSAVPDMRAHFRAAFETIVQDAPAVFFWEQRGALAMTRRITAPPITGDAWWMQLGEWSIAGKTSR